MYRASRRANIACKEAIENAIAENYRDNRLGGDAVPQVIEQFGYTRTLYVLANTVQQKDWDGRFSPANKAWAKTVGHPAQARTDLAATATWTLWWTATPVWSICF